MDRTTPEEQLRRLVDDIVADDSKQFSALLEASPALAKTSFSQGATRQDSSSNFLEAIGHTIYAGDTALHLAAAASRPAMVDALVHAGANVRAKNRRGVEPLHSAAFGNPTSPRWNPTAQTATIARLIAAGANPKRAEYGWCHSAASCRSYPLRGCGAGLAGALGRSRDL